MKRVVILPSFTRSIKKLDNLQKRKLERCLVLFNTYLLTGQYAPGFGLKKINGDKYEFRVDIKLRVVFREEKESIYLVLVGDHDSVRRYLRDYR